jgi:hypothetical protein
LIGALEHAKPRQGDTQYFTRMMISYLMKDDILAETGFGIYSIPRSEIVLGMYDQMVVLDLVNNKIKLDNGMSTPLYGKVMV